MQASQPSRGPNFSYTIPSGWRVIEEGNWSVSLRSTDNLAGITVLGQSGLLQPMSPDGYAYQGMTSIMQLQNVRFTRAEQTSPMPGYNSAMLMDTTYDVMLLNQMVRLQGLVMCNVLNSYNFTNAVITLVASETSQWPFYLPWLPEIAFQVCNTGPDPYGSCTMQGVIRGIAIQDHAAYAAYQDWSKQLWQQVAEQRNLSIVNQHSAMGPMMSGNTWSTHPYTGQPVQHSTNPAVIWVSIDGRVADSDNSTFDPRTPYDSDWRRLK